MSAATRIARGLCNAAAGATVVLPLAGCVSAPPPRELDLGQARIAVVDAAPRLDVSGLPGGKAVGAGVGVGTGTGAGALLGAAGCAAAGPLFGLCLAVVLPATTVAGAVTGGVVGAVKTESVAAMERKTRALKDGLAATSYARLLGERLQDELHSAWSVTLLPPDDPGAIAAPEQAQSAPWTLEVAVIEVGTEGKGEFALRLVSRVALRQDGRADPVWTVDKEVQSETELSTSGWLLADAGAMRFVLDRCVRQAAHELAIDLTRPAAGPAARAHPRSRRSGSCGDVPSEVIKATAS